MHDSIFKAQAADITKIRSIADNVWQAHYSKIISQEQIDFMYPLMYSESSLGKQMEQGHQFFIYQEADLALGFVSMVYENDIIKIPKLYVRIDAQGKSIGKKLILKIKEEAKILNASAVQLNVNRFNTDSIAFYKKVGFEIIDAVDIPLDKFLLEDYVMRLSL